MTDGRGDGYYGPPSVEPPPGLALTIVITLFFGLFGLIPAALAAGKARRAGHSEGRYWIAFGTSLAAAVLALSGILVAVSLTRTVPDAVAADRMGALPGIPSIGPLATFSGAEGHCTYTEVTPSNAYLEDVGRPPTVVPASGSAALTLATNFGSIRLRLDQAKAPCAAASLVYLAQQGFFDGTRCDREVNEPGFTVLQCGDPTGTGFGGASYTYPTEVTGHETYPRGTIAMANNGKGTDDSQFILCIGDTQLSSGYTVVGTIGRAGLAVLDTIAANGNDGSAEPSLGGGAPTKPVTIERATVG